MAKQTIGIGASANDGSGDPIRIAFDKVNDNFNELYGNGGTTGNTLIDLFDSNGNFDLFGKPHKISFLYSTEADLLNVNPGTYHGAIGHAHNTGSLYYAHGSWRRLLSDNSNNDITSYTDPLSKHVYLNNITNAETADYVLKTNNDGTYTWAEQTGGSGGGSYANADVDTHLNVSAAQTNQILSWDGSDFAWVADATGGGGGSYNDAAVDTHLNSGSASSNEILSWNGSDYAWISQSGGGSYSDNDVSSHLNTSAASADQILSWTGSDFAWVDDATGSGGGSSTFAGLTEIALADLDVHDIALQAKSNYVMTGPDSSKYLIDQLPGNNPTIYATAGETIAINIDGVTSSHPLEIRQPNGSTAYNTGLIHYAPDGTKTTGSSAQGKTTGTLFWKIPGNISGTYKYICNVHSGMIGDIVIADPSASGSSGGAASRVNEAETTSSIADGASGSIEFSTLGKSFGLLKVTVNKECWVRIYSDTASRTADASRTQGTDPADGSGVIAEFISTTSGTQVFKVTPSIIGWLDNSETTVPVAVQNNSGTTGTVQVTIDALQLES